MTHETIFTNARIVLSDEIVDGHLVLRDGRIAEIGSGRTGGEDMGGDLMIPGLVELHTDHIEGHYIPRPRVFWNKLAAIQAHDAQIAASGITTVFDAIRVGTDEDETITVDDMVEMGRLIGEAVDTGRTRSDHFIHVRCEVSAADAVDGFGRLADNPRVKLVSLMDHAPGQRQFTDLDAYRVFYQRKKNLTDEEFEAFSAKRMADSAKHADTSRKTIASAARERNITLASHDDATAAHVGEALSYGTVIAEFPTTIEAAKASKAAGLSVLMGAPNVMRGGSHSGNIAALDLIENDQLDILSSDYVPFSLLQAAFMLAGEKVLSLPKAIRLVTSAPATAVGLADRGEIAIGKRADLVRIDKGADGPPIVRAVYREGRRVA
ncbi:alpha-D-ribose 1-methylphosphonate 5-triphosphate diphosphatase [Fulvimarina sp. 2208YS6-2-32]|uniref:Alpha-D-ribose 1-methylphosphonate 5-triphosphate diphosphatase n=1 Tax=Fulvimarina uroteuthidis TaxID=3098149 RepID=A0ABU5I3H3_9HYPH|nr:alpha-D-ribose 1-methylphosphonate 5-triphosphate diphosphatase [Fulvimarina sp. 2208YS6-2-32]MDY8109903.1 alpha-D-ribose 1-methylphosphonate 5-triphosphate diphosphatase [Fulvimarina sp. 2208YS6-2-32]